MSTAELLDLAEKELARSIACDRNEGFAGRTMHAECSQAASLLVLARTKVTA